MMCYNQHGFLLLLTIGSPTFELTFAHTLVRKDAGLTVLMMPLVIQMIADDSDRAFMERIFIEHNRLMFATAWKYCQDRQTAEDIVSDSCVAFIKHLQKIQTLDGNVLRLYIVSTVRNTAINAFKKWQQADAKFQCMTDEGMAQIKSESDTELRVELQDEISLVLNAVGGLPEKEQAVLRLKYSTDYKDDEIAEIVGISASSVRKYIARAREKVKAVVYGKEDKRL
ncbi:MAG: sigma-70 family RNA polymerase sigma factor [Clostridia bacterium]